MWALTKAGEHKLYVFRNKLMRKIFIP